jgi:hypothetical protein
MRIVQLMTDRSRYFNPSKNYWFTSFNAFLISLYFRCLSFRVVLVNTARPDEAFLFVVWFIHWKRMIRPFLFLFRSEKKFRTTRELEYLSFLSRKAQFFFSPDFNISLYDKNSESDFFSLHQDQNFFFSNTGNQNIFFRKFRCLLWKLPLTKESI